MICSIHSLLKTNMDELNWAAISTHPGQEDNTIVNSAKCEARLRWRFRHLQRVWMPINFMQR